MHARCTHDGLSANPLRTLKKPAGRNGRSNRAMLDGRPFLFVFVRSRPFSRVLVGSLVTAAASAGGHRKYPSSLRRHQSTCDVTPNASRKATGSRTLRTSSMAFTAIAGRRSAAAKRFASSSSRGSSPRRRSVDSFRGPSASLRQKRPTEAPDLRREHKASPFVGKAGSHPNGLGLGRPKSQRSNLVGIIDLNDAKPELLREIFGRHGNLHVPIRFDERTGKSVGLGHGFISNSKRTSDAHREAAGGIEHASGGTLCRCPTRARKRFKRVQRSDSPDYVMEICRNFHALLWQIFSEVCRTERDARVLDAHVLDASGNAARRPKRVGKEAREEPLRSSRTDKSRFRRGPSASPAHAL